jgi:twitching motility protein PilT
VAKIDLFLKTITKLGATGMTLHSDENIVLHFPSGDRHAAQKTAHGDLADLVNEVASAEASAALYMEQAVTFDRQWDGTVFALVATPTDGALTVVITEGDAVSSAAAPAAPAASPAKRRALATTPDPTPGSSPAELADGAQDFGSLVQGNSLASPSTSPAASSDRPAPSLEPVQESPGAPSASLAAPASAPPPPVKRRAVRSPVDGSGLVVRLLHKMAELSASDLHLSSNSPPYVRQDGGMQQLEEYGVLAADKLFAELLEIMPDKNQEEFDRRNDTDFAYEIEGLSRYRVNVFRDRFGPGAVIRAIPFEILSTEQLGLPREVLRLCQLSKGLVVVTGPTGSGKSTTLATLVDYINSTRDDHIITVEDPIEFVHPNRRCLVNQREVGEHTDSFKDALRAALREDPDIVLVGEMRDLETVAIAVETAETGHLVFGTLHTTTAAGTVDRIIDQFPADQQEQIRQMLASSLKGVIAQNLCKRIGGGRVAAYEILIANKAVANLIRERKTFQLLSLMQTGRSQGMRTLNDALAELVRKGLVEPMEAYLKAVDKSELRTVLERDGYKIAVAGEE